MIRTGDIAQGEQREKITRKYSSDRESGFWEQFAEKGLTDLEKQAVPAYLKKGDRLLNVGCGCGREAAVLERLGMEVWALDVVQRFVDTARRRLERLDLPARVACADVTEGVPFSGEFDAALLFEQVYQHIPDRRARLRCLANLRASLKPGGLLLLSAFNEGDIDLWARLLWMRDTKWRLADLAAKGVNLLDSRYGPADEEDGPAQSERASRLRRSLWVLAYFRFLLKRKLRARKTLRRGATDEKGCCKALQRSNPQTDSESWFWFRVMSLSELSEELREAHFRIECVYPLLGERYTCSRRSSWGAPLALVVARAEETKDSSNDTDSGLT